MSAEKTSIQVMDLNTPLGPMQAGVTAIGVCFLEFADRIRMEEEMTELKTLLNAEIIAGRNQFSDQLEKELKEYFEGKRKVFDVPLHTPGNEFSQSVWKMLMNIPYGQTWTYKKQAEMLNNPKAIRAIGTTNGRNRLAIIIPCHRVIGSNGSLTGYAGGIEKKKWLLNFEREHSEKQVGLLF